MDLAEGLAAGAICGLTVKPAHRLATVTAFCTSWLRERPQDDESLANSIIAAHDLAQLVVIATLLESAPGLYPRPILASLANQNDFEIKIIQQFRKALETIAERMEDSLEEEQAGLCGGSTEELAIKKLLKKLDKTGDHNAAMEYAQDRARCVCIWAQRPVEQVITDIEAVISGWSRRVSDMLKTAKKDVDQLEEDEEEWEEDEDEREEDEEESEEDKDEREED